MTVAFFIALLAGWAIFSGWRFYKEVNWDDPVGATTDLGELRKKEAALGMIQDVMHDAQQDGKISEACVKEFDRYCEAEIASIRSTLAAAKR